MNLRKLWVWPMVSHLGSKAASATQTEEDLAPLSKVVSSPRERKLIVFLLLLLTFCAAWVNMLAFLSLGRVFASFMTGNFLFIGVGLIQGSHALLVRAIIAVGVYFISIALSSLILGHLLEQRTPLSRFHSFVRFLVPEWFFLLGFALLWQFTNDLSHNDGMQITLLCIAVFAMGIQGVLVQKFDFPGVIVNALTGTEIMLGRRLAQDTIVHRSWWKNTWFLAAQCLTCLLSAIIVVLIRRFFIVQFVPVVVVTIALGILLVFRHREKDLIAR
ncbi:MAG TPA: YoaK family protein [Ktedonobacteraceae bacterium]|nr:YoaK family protein [Ktedonobacteraceae bacterium]